MTDGFLTCELCNVTSDDVRPGIGWFLDESVQRIDRCRDHEACRQRVEASGETWPLRERGEELMTKMMARLGVRP
jgi:hypothetical protein